MATSIKASTLRRLFPRSRFPVSREVADIANGLRSVRLTTLAYRVHSLELDSNALSARGVWQAELTAE